MDKILTAAASILEKAASEVRAFVTKNTPESALLAALALAYQQYSAGALNGTQFAVAAISALVVFVAAEAGKDARQPA